MNQDKILAKSRLADVANEARLQRMKQEEAKALADGGWRCRRCGKVHPYYVGSCGCCLTRQQSKEMDRKAEQLAEEGKKAEEANKEKQLDKDETEEQRDKFEEIKKYKELLDNGIITEEEYNKKKSELLGL
jgi:predicted ATP-dependent serine protease